jgi:hypothetical protein
MESPTKLFIIGLGQGGRFRQRIRTQQGKERKPTTKGDCGDFDYGTGKSKKKKQLR